MLEEFDSWVRENVNCCACGDKMETTNCVTVVELKKVATWKFPVFGNIDIPGYEPRAMAIVCDKCMANKVKIRHCIEWEGTPYQTIYHDVDDLKDCNKSASQMDYYFGKLFKRRQLLRKSAQQQNVN